MIRRTKDLGLVRDLDRACFPLDEPIALDDACVCWALYEGGEAVAYLVGVLGPDPRVHAGSALLDRVGVVEHARGKGYQRRLIRTWLRWAKANNAVAVTYTLPGNCVSGNNMAACGLRMYWPDEPWVGDNVNYWRKQ